MPKEYHLNGLSGLVQQHKSRITGTISSVYNASQAYFDTSGGLWVTVCEAHNTICNHDTLKLAKWHAPDPSMWCADCQANLEANKIAASLTGTIYDLDIGV